MIVVVGLVGGAIYGAKYYYDSTQARIAQLQENNAKLTIANETNQATINRMAQDAVQLEAQNQQLTKDLQQASAYKDELIAKLQKHDLSRLSLKKPGLIEKRINDGTKKVFDALESLSGGSNP
jgi:hypothetical protein